MNFKQNLASVLAGAYKLDYRWLQIKDNEIFIYKDVKDAAETPLALHFDPAFNEQVIALCEKNGRFYCRSYFAGYYFASSLCG